MGIKDSTDGWTLAFNTLKFKENGGRVPSWFTYPPFYYVLASFLPDNKNLLRNLWFSGIACVVVLTLLLTGFFLTFFSNGLLIGLLVIGFVVSPAILIEVQSVSIRPLSFLVFNASVLLMLMGLVALNVFLVVASLIGFVVLLFTHKFAAQTLFVVFFAFSVFLINPIAFLGSMLVLTSLLLFSRVYNRVFKGHKAICVFWSGHSDRQKGGLFQRFSKGAINPFIASAFLAVFLLPNSSELIVLFKAWFLATLFLFVFTAFKSLAFLGENHRYLEYGVIPSLVLTGLLIQFNAWFYWLLPVLLIASCIACWIAVKRMCGSQTCFNEVKYGELRVWLNEQRKGSLFAFGKPRARLGCETKHSVYFNDNPVDWIKQPFIVFDDLISFDWLRQFDYIVSEKELTGFEKAFDNGVYKVYAS